MCFASPKVRSVHRLVDIGVCNPGAIGSRIRRIRVLLVRSKFECLFGGFGMGGVGVVVEGILEERVMGFEEGMNIWIKSLGFGLWE